MRQKHLALVVDDQECSLDHVRPVLRSLGHEFHFAQTQAEAEALLDRHRYCYVLLDLEFPADEDCVARVETGFNLLADLRTRFDRRELPVIIMTAHEKGSEYQVRALQLDANDFASKASDKNFETLDVKVRRVLSQTCAKGRACTRVRTTPVEHPTGEVLHAFHFVGDSLRRRYRLRINGEDTWVCGQTFEILWKLASRARVPTVEGPWVEGRELNRGNYHNAISRSTKDLQHVAGLDGRIFENDGHGRFRVMVAPEQFSFDADCMALHHPRLLERYPFVDNGVVGRSRAWGR